MARAKQAAPGAKGRGKAPNSPKTGPSRRRAERAKRRENAPNSPKTEPPCHRAPPLWKQLRLSRKKPLESFSAGAFRRLLRGFPAGPERVGVQGAAVAALREGCEVHLLALLEEWGLCALHAKRAAVRAADVSLVKCLRVKRA